MPQKRSAEQSTSQASKKVNCQTSQGESLQASTSRQGADNQATISRLQTTVDDLVARLSTLPEPTPVLTEEQVIELIDARLSQQRQEFQQSIQELQELCENGFVNTQASFDAVGEWKEEVQQSFTRIQDWAAAIEKKLVSSEAGQSQLASHDLALRTHQLSSTPSSVAVSSWQTPAAPLITASSALRRPYRLSDAMDLSLATIPEAPNSPCVTEEKRSAVDNATPSRPESENQDNNPRQKHVRISPLSEEIIEPECERLQSSTASERLEKEASLPASDISQPLIAFTPKQITCTPRASKTLFGSEKSTEARFDDVLEVMDESLVVDKGVLPPAWTSLSPSRLLKAT